MTGSERRRSLSAIEAIVGLARVEAELEGFDINAYRDAAEARLARAELLVAREAELAEARRREGGAALAMADLDDRFRLMRAEHLAAAMLGLTSPPAAGRTALVYAR